jgi:hypothetical protein
MALESSHYKVKYETFDLVSDLPEPLEMYPYTAAAEGTNGVLWFATASGVARIDPGHLIRNSVPPEIAIRSLVARGSRIRPMAMPSCRRTPGACTSLTLC